MSCHGTAGTGADTNVEDGFFLSTRSTSTLGEANTIDNAPLLAGGFTNYQGAATTSTHDVSNVATAAWGYGVDRGLTAALAGGVALNCASCHDPHGSTNYRIINEVVNGVAVVVTQVDEGVQSYDTETWPADITNVCAACHDAYHVVTGGSGSDLAYLASGGFTHRVDMSFNYGGNINPEPLPGPFADGLTLPLAGADLVTCNTCHLSHGSSSAMAGFADVAVPPGNTSATYSALLRLDNRGVCEVYQK
jgi:hypothetical protein